MKLCTVTYNDERHAAVVTEENVVFIRTINTALTQQFPNDVHALVQFETLQQLRTIVPQLATLEHVAIHDVQFETPYNTPTHIFGVGMNYQQKLEDLQAERAEEPVVFMKPASTIASLQHALQLPTVSTTVSAEGELALVIGKRCHDVSEEEALSYVSAYTTSLDLTAKDIHAKNPRFLQMSKVFPTFFSFGPVLITADEIEDLEQLRVQSVHNGRVIHENTIDHMMYSPAYIVSYISQFVELQAGDIIMTGTPGSFIIQAGDEAACVITQMIALQHTVC